MKKIFYLIAFLTCWIGAIAQTVTPSLKAGFGIEGELRANFYNNFAQSGNDDWFNMGTPGSGAFVIDTTGAASIVSRYASDPSFRQLPFFRTMRYPAYSIVNNKMLLDAIFIRDYHGTDSTIFASGASKNGESPADWTCPVAQSVPDKNEILDMMVHVRRAGPNSTDSLWMFGGLSIENTTGDRYFDFEMYQTDIYYDRATQRFYGYGPDAGHTSWKFDAAGNITQPGDIIFSADFGSSTLSSLEARIWVNSASLSTTPVDFNWSGSFDGASSGSQYGYAGILPKTAGNFYYGVESPNNTWAGPFSLVRGDNSVVTTYTAGQFMEIGVNLSKIGLDPVTLLGSNSCGMPFRRILVKSRASTSFTSALKDFVGPFDFFLPARANIQSDQSVLCGLIGNSTIRVTNPLSTSTYTWSTTDGHILSTSSTGDSIVVDSAGTYVVTQQLQAGCSTYATDTVVIFYNSNCFVLENKLLGFSGNMSKGEAHLNWAISQSDQTGYFNVERSVDGVNFVSVSKVFANRDEMLIHEYSASDTPDETSSGQIYYRVKITNKDGSASYSKTIRLFLGDNGKPGISIAPNPVRGKLNLNISSLGENEIQLFIYDGSGRLMRKLHTTVPNGNSSLTLTDFQGWPRGIYSVKALLGENSYVEKMVLVK
ncbi:T9SS type A sorting domain-containing protein [Ginsengibacter hankyongi]|uniref:T9SS type A sorting domain-containing protein n=1 Tax=Ginsengibacter hankyongi TaxID=2607284 RepID=A0A5J5IF25_9BACT|nr:T9SS type A sorting domain-containing protein [Ginsengibacter hankyongi]KAA9038493.1 T9SS type A sorting domain-containing protein [Ginsengibacter hankyongi]